jgi:hypothetical protein
VREDTRQRATEFVRELYAAGAIDAGRLDTIVDEVLAARSETELAGVIWDVSRSTSSADEAMVRHLHGRG